MKRTVIAAAIVTAAVYASIASAKVWCCVNDWWRFW